MARRSEGRRLLPDGPVPGVMFAPPLPAPCFVRLLSRFRARVVPLIPGGAS